jgi:nitrogen fixation/metabolism regulation signal transduction histidine kinase
MLRYLAIVCVALVAIAFFLVASSSSNPRSSPSAIPMLLGLNGAIAFMLTVLVVYQLITLRRSEGPVCSARGSRRGSCWCSRSMAVVPGALIYGLSVQFMTRPSSRGSTCAWTRRSKAG